MLKLLKQTESQDQSVKVLWELSDRQTVESVILPRALKQRKGLSEAEFDADAKRFTACLSSQVGCAMACDFCLTGKQGLIRHLTQNEIVGQVLELNKIKPITNIVFMGMGEPLNNLSNVIPAIRHFLAQDGLGLSRRRIVVSTSGVVSALPELAKTGVRLAISLNATTDDLRSQIMPVNRKHPIQALINTAKAYAITVGQTVMVEYILLRDLNDSQEDAERLFQLTRDWNCKVNLIPFNRFDGSDYHRPLPEHVKAFQHSLVSRGVTATVRYSGGDDIYAACGMLQSLNTPIKAKRDFFQRSQSPKATENNPIQSPIQSPVISR